MQNLRKYYGFEVDVSNSLTDKEYETYRKAIIEFIEKEQLEGVEAYVHKIRFTIAPNHFQINGLVNRLSGLDITARLTKKQVESRKMRFVNDRLTSIRLSPDIQGRFNPAVNSYHLPGTYVEKNNQFQEILVVLVKTGLKSKLRKIELSFSPRPTDNYVRKMKNYKHPRVTKTNFYLKNTVQLKLPAMSA